MPPGSKFAPGHTTRFISPVKWKFAPPHESHTATRAPAVFVLDSGQSVRGHKGLLSARSSYIRAMFESGMAEASSGTVRVRDCSGPSFEAFLQVGNSRMNGCAYALLINWWVEGITVLTRCPSVILYLPARSFSTRGASRKGRC